MNLGPGPSHDPSEFGKKKEDASLPEVPARPRARRARAGGPPEHPCLGVQVVAQIAVGPCCVQRAGGIMSSPWPGNTQLTMAMVLYLGIPQFSSWEEMFKLQMNLSVKGARGLLFLVETMLNDW